MTRQICHTLIVFGGGIFDPALATNFVMLVKKFKADGHNPTCLSSINICSMVEMAGPLLFGRVDLGRHIEIYNWEEAKRPFYKIVHENLKKEVLDWMQKVSKKVQTGDRITIILIAHGSKHGHGIILGSQSLTKKEVTSALSIMPDGIRILIVNGGCFSGMWVDLARELSPKKDIMVETAATKDQKAWNYRSASDGYRYTLFGSAFAHEISTYPEGHISQHRLCIQEEMEHVAPDQETSGPSVNYSRRALRSHNISHLILTPYIANAAAKNQKSHEETLTARERARRLWGKLCRRNVSPGGEISSGITDSQDHQIATIQHYISSLGTAAAELKRCTLVTACHVVLDGRGGEQVKKQVIRTIKWQEAQSRRVASLLSHLVSHGLITCALDAKDAERAVENSNSGSICQSLGFVLIQSPEIKALGRPTREKNCIEIHFDDAIDWLVNALVINFLNCPGCFHFKSIEKTTIQYLQEG